VVLKGNVAGRVLRRHQRVGPGQLSDVCSDVCFDVCSDECCVCVCVLHNSALLAFGCVLLSCSVGCVLRVLLAIVMVVLLL
jgi:hypothetical protein